MKVRRFQFVVLLMYLAMANLSAQETNNSKSSGGYFKEVKKDFPRKEKNLRKWDAPVIADLDQDGFVDILLNDHGLGVSVSWNNKGKFEAPYDIIMGDLHGVSVGDIDNDGLLEMILSRGGGSGSNARNSKIYRIGKDRSFTALPDFDVPLELMRGRTVQFIDGDNDGDLDLLNFAFPDKERKGASENYIYENVDGQMILKSTLPAAKMNGQKTLTTDFNNDGVVDIVLYGHGAVKLYEGNGDLTYRESKGRSFPNNINHARSIVEIDYDNDGDFDLFITRGKEFEIGETFYDPATELLGFFTKRGPFQFDVEVGDILNVINFPTQWPDNDAFYIGETGYPYEFSGETHSGKDMRLVNSDALGYPDKLRKKGTHIGYIGNQTWRVAGNLWAPGTAVIGGVPHFKSYDHPEGYSDILLENRKGKFVDVTVKANLSYSIDTEGATVADIDNNGYSDLLIVRRGDLIHSSRVIIYLNNGQGGFKLLKDHEMITSDIGSIGMAIETIDYNQDGRKDLIIGNERGKWHLFKNTFTGDNNFLTLEVGNAPSGKATDLGALIKVTGCKMTQTQRVGTTGAAYSLNANNFVHFGLGKCFEAQTVLVTWSNGESKTYTVAPNVHSIMVGK